MPVIKRYANRKLYDTHSGQYVTLEDLAAYIRRGEEVEIVDHASGRDLTTLTLMQVLFQEEKRLGELIPQVVLTRLIRTGGETLDTLRARLLAAFDPDGLVEEELRRRIEQMVLRGELAAAEAARFLDKLLDPTRRWDVPYRSKQSEDEPFEAAQAALQALTQQVAALEQELKRIKQSAIDEDDEV